VTVAHPASPTEVKCACADLWAHPIAQLLAGPAMRPGGRASTATILDDLALAPGARVLDIGSGTGATLDELGSRALRPFGVDYSSTLAAQAAEIAPVAVGDGESLPYPDQSFEAVFAECVLSALPDKRTAVGEVRRVLVDRGTFVLTDMVLEGVLPEPLESVAAWAACVGGALSLHAYEDLLVEYGFSVRSRFDMAGELEALVGKVQRRLAILRGALGVGLLREADAVVGTELAPLGAGSMEEFARFVDLVFRQVRAAIAKRELGYVAIVSVT
jgi:SAM-dependent methyltransferase